MEKNKTSSYLIEVVHRHEIGSMPETNLIISTGNTELHFTPKQVSDFNATLKKAIKEMNNCCPFSDDPLVA